MPNLPAKPGHLQLFLMHNLLLHAGLPADVLPQLLPFSPLEIHRVLREFQARGVAELDQDRWRVTTAGYPAVRGALNDDCYVVDDL